MMVVTSHSMSGNHWCGRKETHKFHLWGTGQYHASPQKCWPIRYNTYYFLSVCIIRRVYVQNGVKKVMPPHYLSKTFVSNVLFCKFICNLDAVLLASAARTSSTWQIRALTCSGLKLRKQSYLYRQPWKPVSALKLSVSSNCLILLSLMSFSRRIHCETIAGTGLAADVELSPMCHRGDWPGGATAADGSSVTSQSTRQFKRSRISCLRIYKKNLWFEYSFLFKFFLIFLIWFSNSLNSCSKLYITDEIPMQFLCNV